MDEQPSQTVREQSEFGNAPTTRTGMSALTWFCIGYYLIAMASGARSAVVFERSAGDLVFDFALAVCLYSWASFDARQRQKPIPRSLRLWFFAFAVLVVPGYVIATRGWKGAGWVVFHALGWVVVATLAMIVTLVIYLGLLR